MSPMPMSLPRRFATRVALMMALLLAGFGVLVALLGWRVMVQHEQESLQRLSHGLAQHIVEHWPHVARPERDAADRAEREALLQMLMVVNPGVQVYVLDANGKVDAYIGEPGMVRSTQVDLDAVRAFLAGAALPLHGSDPMANAGSGVRRIFSAAMFAPRAGDTRPPGYLYVVLDGAARVAAGNQANVAPAWRSVGLLVGVAFLISLALALFLLRRLTQPLERLAQRMSGYHRLPLAPASAPGATPVAATPALPHGSSPTALELAKRAASPLALAERAPHDPSNELQTIDRAFAAMTARIESQAEQERQQAHDHRETMASVAHDLRTPLTALHGHLEALARDGDAPAVAPGLPSRERLLHAALVQSDKVRRLSQQLFELAALQSSSQLVQRERFSIDELVTDAVQKFELTSKIMAHSHHDRDDLDAELAGGADNSPQAKGPQRAMAMAAGTAAVTLGGAPPGRLELEGDLQLIERALTNLIDNALRHAAGAFPVRVSLHREGGAALIVVEDSGPGLPAELLRRLLAGQSVREPPVRRSGGGIGGLGLAIAQRVAVLHGGSLKPLPTPQGGTRLCLALPLAA
jgi:signal transduction histidine kinase